MPTDSIRKYHREWYERNRDKVRASQRAWRKRNPDYAKRYYRKTKKRNVDMNVVARNMELSLGRGDEFLHAAFVPGKKYAGRTALSFAAQNGCVRLVDALVRAGHDVDQTDDDGTTPIVRAVLHGELGVVETLLEWGACPDVHVRDVSLLRVALDDTPIALRLIEYGADTRDLLTEAIEREDWSVADALFTREIDSYY